MAVEKVDMSGRVCVVTGANTGIGKETCVGLADMGATVVMVCRSEERGSRAQADIKRRTGNDNVDLFLADFASQASIREFAKRYCDKYDKLHVLVNNAGLFMSRREETEDGLEMQFGVNHIGPFLLTNLLLDTIKASAPARIVNVSSTLHQKAKLDFDDLQSERRYGAIKAYGESKLANVLFTYELAKRLEGTGVTVNCLHPGGVRTKIMRDLPLPLRMLTNLAGFLMDSPKKGAETSIYLATSPEVEGVTGKYFVNCHPARSNAFSHDEYAQKRLWEESERLIAA